MTCLRCGYDLSYTPPTAACPECGLGVERSTVSSRHPDDAPPKWVWSIAIGTILLLIAYLIPLILFSIQGLAFQLEHYNAPLIILASLMVFALLAHWLADYLLSRDDRPRPFAAVREAHRWSLRILPLGPLLVAAIAIATLYQSARTTPFFLANFQHRIHGWIPAFEAVAVCFMLNQTLTFIRLRWLAQRLNQPRLAEHIGIVAAGLGGALLLVGFVAIPSMVIIHESNLWFVLLVALPWSLLALFSAWAVFLLVVICPLFWRSAKHASAKWLAADATRNLSHA